MDRIHDSIIISYEVNLEERYIKIVLNNDKKERKILCFSNVLTHVFEDIVENSIIMEISEQNIRSFFIENHDMLNKKKDYCWPVDYQNLRQLEKIILKENLRYFVLKSSYGLYGWVLATQIEII